ncbi:DUF305 domain-containing protein [Saccharothrix sp. ALI-22-I]|uniref:DUF305 domain-containing protein n=1 Tax=Saccharothrix sp. ALI-22-I TaxID=1933778 RepID=UPI00097C978C|nr:DUF305 domain-containing protein [Saccharothrix sp. ALI-22-I]ONI80069.1 DUF305 domain-containing protein [Saccharothrix sp. ALI-22-I]
MRRRPAAAVIGLMVWILAGCGVAGGGTTPVAQTGSGASETDVRFSQQMIPHHQQSIQLAKLASQRSTGEFVKTTATEITTAETEEIELMSGWLQSWNVDVPAAGTAGHSMHGMLSAAEISLLENASGADFDRQWLVTMAKHLRSGVEMAKTALATGQHAPTKTLAQEIVTGQGARIAAIDGRIAQAK